MKSKKVLSLLSLLILMILAIINFVFLPETVVTQLSFGGNVSTMPKIPAVALPTLLGIGFSIASLIVKGSVKENSKFYIVPAICSIILIVMLIVNL